VAGQFRQPGKFSAKESDSQQEAHSAPPGKRQFLLPGIDRQPISSPNLPETGRYDASQLAGLATPGSLQTRHQETEKASIPQFRLSASGNVGAPQFRLPVTDRHSASQTQFPNVDIPDSISLPFTVADFPAISPLPPAAPDVPPSHTPAPNRSDISPIPPAMAEILELVKAQSPVLDKATIAALPAAPIEKHAAPSLPPPAASMSGVSYPFPSMPFSPTSTPAPPVAPTAPIQPPMISPPTVAPTPCIQPPAPGKPRSTRLEQSTPFIAVLFNVAIVLLITWLTLNKVFLPASNPAGNLAQTSTTPALNSITNNKNISPLIFGTNMALFHDNDEPILNSPATRQLLKDIGVRVIRMPTRPTLNPETEIKAAQAIKEIGAVPLILINGPEFKGGPVLQTDQQLLSMFTSVFGKETVYYEFGNEADLNGVDVAHYVAVWNQVIPQLKQQFPTARFIAPDNYQFSRRYLKTFLQQAQPRPDGVSWHEYTCSVHWTAAFCLSLLDTWPIHFAQARAAMREAIGTTLPIWITEWNYVSDQEIVNGQPINDGKYNDPTFMTTWTTRAMQTLIANRVYASMQYFATDPPMPLISNDKIGIEGTIFQQEYKKIMVDGYTPPEMTSIPPATPPPANTPLAFSFEDGTTEGWTSAGGNGITTPQVSTAHAFVGTHALEFTLSNASENDYPYITIPVNRLPSVPKAGQMISAYVYVANKDAIVNAKIFVANQQYHWYFSADLTMTSGQWSRVWYALPMNFSDQITQIGIQFYTSKPGVSSDVYIDAINWS
jgi:hypothetical protein